MSIIDYKFITKIKQWQWGKYNALKNDTLFRYDYALGDIVYVDKTDIFQKLYSKIYLPYRIIEVYTNNTFRF